MLYLHRKHLPSGHRAPCWVLMAYGDCVINTRYKKKVDPGMESLTNKEQKANISILLSVWIIHLRNAGLQLLRDGSLEPTFTAFFLTCVLLAILSVWICMCASPFLALTLQAYRHWNHISVYYAYTCTVAGHAGDQSGTRRRYDSSQFVEPI